MSEIKLLLGDCIEVLKTIPDNSVDSIVTDPPYGLGFMGKEWDTFDKSQFGNIPDECSENNVYNKKGFNTLPRYKTDGLYQFANDWAKECLRVLKPGGHLLSFAGSRTYHKICMGIEDAGFEIRDQIMWVYGSGFPKSLNIGKAIDKIKGNHREVIGMNPNHRNTESDVIPLGFQGGRSDGIITKGNSEWEGWGTALKPAHEPIVMARKPLSEKSIAENVLKHGTGGINIDGSRIDVSEKEKVKTDGHIRKGNVTGDERTSVAAGQFGDGAFVAGTDLTNGRFPANIIFDEEAGKLLDEQAPLTGSAFKAKRKKDVEGGSGASLMRAHKEGEDNGYFDERGGASRFFYCPKTSKKDRNEGLDNFEDKVGDIDKQAKRRLKCADCDNWYVSGNKEKECKCLKPNWIEPKTKNNHPTVKPTDLMRYLINLVTPKGGTTLDPFMGSGSTGKAAVRCGVNFIGIEKESEYMEIAKARIEYEKNKPVQGELL